MFHKTRMRLEALEKLAALLASKITTLQEWATAEQRARSEGDCFTLDHANGINSRIVERLVLIEKRQGDTSANASPSTRAKHVRRVRHPLNIRTIRKYTKKNKAYWKGKK